MDRSRRGAGTRGQSSNNESDSTEIGENGALAGDRHRVVATTDIGGSDPDDFQSMVHLLLYADVLDIEGLVSSPGADGRKEDLLRVINHYEKDYENLQTYSGDYPTPEELRAMTAQGETERAPYDGVRKPTEGSELIIERARVDDPRPLYVLGWGLLEDIAQAIHDAPEILPKLRVYWIGGPNKKWGADAYQYIVDNHPELWMIENNATYRGWFNGGRQDGEWSNTGFVEEHVDGKGALGEFFASKLGGRIKMGDTPSVAWLLRGTPDDPSRPSWGGRFVRSWDRPFQYHEQMPMHEDEMEEFGVLELALPVGHDVPDDPEATLEVTNQSLPAHFPGDGTMRVRFCPKAAGTYDFEIQSNVPALDGETGGITAVTASPDLADQPSETYPNWWTDDPSPELAEDGHIGAKTINRWREDYLRSFEERMDRCDTPQS